MSSKWRYVLGTVTIVVIIGGTIYAIKKSKDVQKAEEKEISLDEVKAMMEAKKIQNEVHKRQVERIKQPYTRPTLSRRDMLEQDDIVDEDEDLTEMIDESRDFANFQSSFNPEPEEEAPHADEEFDEDEDEVSEFMYIEEGIDPKEDKDLRHDPNSMDARHQFIRMELAEWAPLEDPYQILLNLFEFPFQPRNDGDHILRSQIMDFRKQFFGHNSRWSKEVSVADVILHFARAAEFNCGESVRYWSEYFLTFNEIEYNTPSKDIDEILTRLNSHTYFNEERQTFGLFGLSRESMNEAIRIANGNVDRSVTYEIEFNEFLKSII